jgi:hypothetical protein
MRVITRNDDVIKGLAAGSDKLHHVVQQFKRRNAFEPRGRILKNMQVSQLQDASCGHE